MNKRIFDDFDEYASNYRAIHNQNIKISGVDSFYFAEMKVELLKGFEKQDNLKVLDIGCGDGTSEIFFQKYFPNWIIYGIDISAESISEAKKTNLPNCTFSVFDGLTVPFENCAFDLVFIAGVLHHVSFSMHSKIISEVNRVLNNNGRLYLFEHNPLNPLTRHLVNTCVFDKDAKLLFHFYTKKLLRMSNLIINKTDFIIFFPRKKFFKKLLSAEKYLKWLPLGGQYFIRAIKY